MQLGRIVASSGVQAVFADTLDANARPAIREVFAKACDREPFKLAQKLSVEAIQPHLDAVNLQIKDVLRCTTHVSPSNAEVLQGYRSVSFDKDPAVDDALPHTFRVLRALPGNHVFCEEIAFVYL